MMEINKDSVCLRCAHLKTISVEDWYSIDRTIALVDCEEEVYAFPFQTNYPCAYFKKGENYENYYRRTDRKD